ncbi:secretin and TonB N-terminal domain-containing protein [Nitrincola iocasae]|uniref:TonB-dependent receptor plug domain-containing protein n=1 Tax=Nitrincola iocasae TaxID=2614693 RepID=A0A5J6LIT0_9GAMM|nr:secretin and TonB N-terminal domain-containing protein [Nitrincola iocasae]QEW08226.1 TonB-dependent receptor plug domain-containing protein [Nitrincola iocasae]
MSFNLVALPFKSKPLPRFVLLGALGMGLSVGWTLPSVAAATSAHTETHHLNIADGDLGQALNALGHQTGILLSYSPDLVDGMTSPELSGQYTVLQGLGLLLSGTGLQTEQLANGGFLIRSQSNATDDQAAALPLMQVEGAYTGYGYAAIENGEMRNAMRGDLAETLSIIPSVRVADSSSSSLQQGDIKPAELSIRGASPYQNKLMLDGASIDNLMDPAQRENPSNYTNVAGHSQGIFLNTDFLSQVEVIDVNASASEGGFSGGVIKAETKSYDGEDFFSISQRRTRDSWTNFHIDPAQLGEFGDGAAQAVTGVPGDFQPNFRKDQLSLQGATRIGDIGIFAGLDEKTSRIWQKQVVDIDFDHFAQTGRIFKPSEERSLDTYSRSGVLRLDWLEQDYLFNASLAFSEYDEDTFFINYLDSDFDSRHQGLNLSVNYGQHFGNTRLDLNVSAGISSDERYFKNDVLDKYRYTTIYQGGFIGGYGDLESEQRTLTSTLKLSTPLTDALTFDYGGELRWLNFRQNRLNDFTYNEYTLDFTQPLPPQTGLGSWSPSDQYHVREVIYQAGEIKFNNLNAAAFTELNGDHQRFFWHTGLRLERDDWLGNTNLAPRLSAGIYLDDAKRYRITAGANRYYGKSFMAYRLRELERDRILIRSRTSPTAEYQSVDANRDWFYQDLDTPYDDELNLGISGPLMSGEAGLMLVERKGERQVRTRYDAATDMHWFDNSGSSRTHQVDLYWRSTPAEWLGAYWAINTSASWMDKQTDTTYGNSSSGYLSNSNSADDEVWFEGKRILKRDLPANDFATPVSLNLDLITRSGDDRIQLRNAFAFTNGYRSLRNVGTDPATGLKQYEVHKQGSTLRWDMSIDLRLLQSRNSPYLRLDVVNVTDNQNTISAESNVQLFGVGRQYWLELGYKF